MNRIAVLCWDICIDVRSENADFISFISTLDHIAGIPVFCSTNYPVNINPSTRFHLMEGTQPSLHFDSDSKTLTLTARWSEIKRYPTTVTNLLGQLLSLACVNNELYPMHSAAIRTDAGATLIVGPPGSGKTLLSISLATTHTAKWLANDWLALTADGEQVIVNQGHDLIDFNPRGLSQLKPFVSTEIIKRIGEHEQNTLGSPPKGYLFSPDELELEKGELPCFTNNVIFVEIGPGLNAALTQLTTLHASELIAKEIFWPLRGLGSFVFGKSGEVLCSSVVMEPSAGWDSMRQMVNRVARSCRCYALSANLVDAVSSVKSIVGTVN